MSWNSDARALTGEDADWFDRLIAESRKKLAEQNAQRNPIVEAAKWGPAFGFTPPEGVNLPPPEVGGMFGGVPKREATRGEARIPEIGALPRNGSIPFTGRRAQEPPADAYPAPVELKAIRPSVLNEVQNRDTLALFPAPAALKDVRPNVLKEVQNRDVLAPLPPAAELKAVPPRELGDLQMAEVVPIEEFPRFSEAAFNQEAREGRDAGYDDSLLWGFTTSDEEMIRVLARRFYPHNPSGNVWRFRRRGDNFVHLTDDGLYWALPNGFVGRWTSRAGSALPYAFGIGLGLVTGPAAPIGGSVGAVAGEGVRQLIGDALMGKDADWDLDEAAATDAAISGFFTGPGGALIREFGWTATKNLIQRYGWKRAEEMARDRYLTEPETAPPTSAPVSQGYSPPTGQGYTVPGYQAPGATRTPLVPYKAPGQVPGGARTPLVPKKG